MNPQGNTPPYAETELAFRALVSVDTATRLLAQHLDFVQRQMAKLPLPSQLDYEAPAPAECDEETRAEIEERRTERRRWNSHWFKVFDQYHRLERKWRDSIAKAKDAADGAANELDLATTPPLQRTTVAIKRSLQKLGGSIPAPIVVGDTPPSEADALSRLRQQQVEVAQWIAELRLLVVPRSPELEVPLARREGLPPTPPQGSTDSIEVHPTHPIGPQAKQHELSMLQAMLELGATSRDTARSAVVLTRHRFGGRGNAQYQGDVLTEMKRRGWVDSRPSRGGGYWILEAGCEVIRRHSPPPPPATSQSGST